MAVTYDHGTLELAAAPASPHFAELSEEPSHNPPADRHPVNADARFAAADEEAHRDLDTPAFLRTSRY